MCKVVVVALAWECRLSERYKSLDQMTHVVAELWRVQPRNMEYDIRNITATPVLVNVQRHVCSSRFF
jgi:hypothetical protein